MFAMSGVFSAWQKPETFSTTNRFTLTPVEVIDGTTKSEASAPQEVPTVGPKAWQRAASNGVPDMTIGTGFAEVLTTCTRVATTACAALGVKITPTIATSATAPATINNRFAKFMFSSSFRKE
jgi:hypothetical protein